MQRLPGHEAARRLQGFEAFDPAGIADARDVARMCDDGQCFAIDGAAQAVYVLRVRGAVAWVDAARGAGPLDLVGVLDAIVTEQSEGLDAIALQTMRPGLVRKLKRRGFRVTGWILKRDIDHGI